MIRLARERETSTWLMTSAASRPGRWMLPTRSSRWPAQAQRQWCITRPVGETTWFGLACEIFRLLGADPARVRPVTSSAYPRPAPRPAYGVLGHRAWPGLTLSRSQAGKCGCSEHSVSSRPPDHALRGSCWFRMTPLSRTMSLVSRRSTKGFSPMSAPRTFATLAPPLRGNGDG
jgi:hypothetical protein